MNFHLFQDSRKRTNMTKTITRLSVIAARESLPISYNVKQLKQKLLNHSRNRKRVAALDYSVVLCNLQSQPVEFQNANFEQKLTNMD